MGSKVVKSYKNYNLTGDTMMPYRAFFMTLLAGAMGLLLQVFWLPIPGLCTIFAVAGACAFIIDYLEKK